uniref:Macro domain-containing protein n=1 Tax=viral metagenome TaxID=1070528 RepID=A0A6C0E9G3_9ZZZZ
MKSLKLTFVDLDGQFTSIIHKELISDPEVSTLFNSIETYSGDIKDFNDKCSNEKGLAYLSSGNSFGFMDYGIDVSYNSDIFPGIEKEVRWDIENVKRRNLFGKAYLPIGSALITKRRSNFLITAPTMWMSQDVSKTNNTKHAFLGVLCVIYLWNHYHPNEIITHLVCPELATGFGKMTLTQSVKQIKNAIYEFDIDKLQPYHFRIFQEIRTYLEENPDVIKEQPNYYQNTQWKQIEPSSILINKID